MSKEALKLALEHAKRDERHMNHAETRYWCRMYRDIAEKAIEALAEQPAQQEPVIWMYVNKSRHETKFQKHMRDFVDHGLWAEVPLYGEPLANHELQCVCGAVWLGDEMVHLPDKRPPASKPWVGLTDEEMIDCERLADIRHRKHMGSIRGQQLSPADQFLWHYARAIEAKLREKNT